MSNTTTMLAGLRDKASDKVAQGLLDQLLKRLVWIGRVRVKYWDGRICEYVGAKSAMIPWLNVAITDPAVVWAILREPTKGVAIAYTSGTLDVAAADLPLLCQLLNENRPQTKFRVPYRYSRNVRDNQAGQVQAHYDRAEEGDEVKAAEYYALFLGETGVYTCARFHEDDKQLPDMEALTTAQERKVRTTLEKLNLRPGERLLEMGCGSGYAAVYAARHFGVRVVATTLSKVQWEAAKERARKWGVAHLVDFRLVNCHDLTREADGRFDAILSIGMIEHMGEGNYDELVRKMDGLLVEGGRVLVHGIMQDPLPSRLSGPRISPWVDEKIFPGGHLPTLAEVIHHFQQGGFVPHHMENLYIHYARTLELWWKAHTASRDQIVKLYSEEFYRQQTLWLVASMVGFSNGEDQPKGRLHLFQVLLTKGKRGDYPFTPAFATLSL